ncbi:SRPBCC family protein [Amycolatopsis japonica]
MGFPSAEESIRYDGKRNRLEHAQRVGRVMASVTRSLGLPATAREVWSLIGEFGAVDRWFPGVEDIKLRQTDAGLERVVMFGGTEFVERLVELDEEAMYVVYTMPDPPLPISHHRARLSVAADGEANCTVTWSATFDADGEVLAMVDDAMGEHTFQVGLDALAARFGGRGQA